MFDGIPDGIGGGNIVTTKVVRLQTECMVTRKTQINLHGMPMFMSEDHLRAFCKILPC